MNRIQHRVLLISLAFLLVLVGNAFQAIAAEYIIKGNLLGMDAGSSNQIPVSLMVIQLDQQPAKKQYQQVMSGDGEFLFLVDPEDAGNFFRVETEVNGQMIGSEPFKLSLDEPVRTVNIQVASQNSGQTGEAMFLQEILIVDLLEDGARVTDILIVENPTKNWINVTPDQMVKKLPAEARNPQVFRSQSISNSFPSDGQIALELSLAPGRHQLVFSYDMSVSGKSLTFRNELPANIRAIEVLTMKNQLAFTMVADDAASEIVTQEKQLGSRNYLSRQVKMDRVGSGVEIRLIGFPSPQAIITYPAYILVVFLLAGFGYFLFRISRAKPRVEASQA